ncbi:MAG: elongation factor G, partial [Deltaproteobacteria bacterium]|nr:elongation factor G [Deltaproteobacteria bacterium]
MKSYKPSDVRVVGLFGHRGSGKTSLAEAFLYNAGVTSRLGSVDAGNLTLEIDEAAIEKQMTMAANAGFVEWNGVRVGLIDTPGDGNFWGSTLRALDMVDSALVTVGATDGIEPITSRTISGLSKRSLPFAVIVTKLDKDNTDFDATVEEIKGELKQDIAVLSLPIGKAGELKGVISLVSGKAYVLDGDKTKETDIPADMADSVESVREQLLDAVAAADDDLAEKYLEEGTLSEEDLARGLKAAVVKGSLVPLLAAGSTQNIGARVALDIVHGLFPAPNERPAVKGYKNNNKDDMVERNPTPDAPFVAQVFRTYYDPFAGMLTYARVWSGKLSAGSDAYNTTRDSADRSSHIYFPQGGTKNGAEAKEIQAGDVVVLTKLKVSRTGDTLSVKDDPTYLEPFDEPEALLNFGLSAKEQTDEDKMATIIHKLLDEDPSLRFERDPDSGETLLGGLGQAHVDYVVDRLKRSGIEVELREPKVPYKETIRGKIEGVEGKHKKQSGGSGQYGVAFLNVEPQTRGDG